MNRRKSARTGRKNRQNFASSPVSTAVRNSISQNAQAAPYSLRISLFQKTKALFFHQTKPLPFHSIMHFSSLSTPKNTRPSRTGLKENGWLSSGKLLRETRFHKLDKPFHRLLLIGAASNDPDIRSAHNAEGKNAKQALCIHAAFFFFHPNGGFVLIAFWIKKVAGRACRPT